MAPVACLLISLWFLCQSLVSLSVDPEGAKRGEEELVKEIFGQFSKQAIVDKLVNESQNYQFDNVSTIGEQLEPITSAVTITNNHHNHSLANENIVNNYDDNNDDFVDPLVASNQSSIQLIEPINNQRRYDLQRVPNRLLVTSAIGTASITARHRHRHKRPSATRRTSVELSGPKMKSFDELVVREANAFGARLLVELDSERRSIQNVHAAPLAVYETLALLLSGARGQTAIELENVLLSSLHDKDIETRTSTADGNTEDAADPISYPDSEDFEQITKPLPEGLLGRTDIAMSISRLMAKSGHFLSSSSSSDASMNTTRCRQADFNGQRQRQSQQLLVMANNWLTSSDTQIPSRELDSLLNLMGDRRTSLNSGAQLGSTVITRAQPDSAKESLVGVNAWFRERTCQRVAQVIHAPPDGANKLTPVTSAWFAAVWPSDLVEFRRVAWHARVPPQVTRDGDNIRWSSTSNEQNEIMKAPIVEDSIVEITINDDQETSGAAEKLMEFVNEDTGTSHFVEFIESQSIGSQSDLLASRQAHYASNVARGISVDAVEIPFAGTNLTIVAIVPRSRTISRRRVINRQLHAQDNDNQSSDMKDTAARITSNLNLFMSALDQKPHETLDELWTQLANSTNNSISSRIALPILQMRTERPLSAILSKLGVNSLFEARGASLSGLSDLNSSNSIYVNEIIHVSALNVDESGVNFDPMIGTLEAVRRGHQSVKHQLISSTINGDAKNSSLKSTHNGVVRLNRPFVYLIRDRSTGLIWFAGCVRLP